MTDPLDKLGQAAGGSVSPTWESARTIAYNALNEAHTRIYETSQIDGSVVEDEKLVFLYVGTGHTAPCLVFQLSADGQQIEMAYGQTIRMPGASGGEGNPVLNAREVQGVWGFGQVNRDDVIEAVNIWADQQKVFA